MRGARSVSDFANTAVVSVAKVTCSLAQYAMQLPVLLRNLQPVFTAGLYPVGAAGRHIKRRYLRVISHILPYKFQCHAIVWTDFPSSLSSPSLCSNVPSNRSHGHGVWVAASVGCALVSILWCVGACIEQAGVGLLLGEQKDSPIVSVKQVVPRGSADRTGRIRVGDQVTRFSAAHPHSSSPSVSIKGLGILPKGLAAAFIQDFHFVRHRARMRLSCFLWSPRAALLLVARVACVAMLDSTGGYCGAHLPARGFGFFARKSSGVEWCRGLIAPGARRQGVPCRSCRASTGGFPASCSKLWVFKLRIIRNFGIKIKTQVYNRRQQNQTKPNKS